MRFELIDRVLECGKDRLVAVKNVTTAEEYLADHFPGFPVLPGVMMLEALVQGARALLDRQAAHPARAEGEVKVGQRDGTGPHGSTALMPPLVVTQVRNVKYGNMVRPGQTLRVEVILRKGDSQCDGQTDGGFEFQGKGTVDGQVAVQGRFRLTPLEGGPRRAITQQDTQQETHGHDAR